MQEPQFGQEDEQEQFLEIQKFAGELLGDPNLTLRVLADEDQLSITTNGLRLPLENCGTGIHHLILLCGAVAIHKNATILLEEPELHLHPELQRRFLQFLVERTNNRCIFTTHSNVFLDAQNQVCAYHVRHDGKLSYVEEARPTTTGRALLVDLGYKPSDLLQANGVVWVEGPSDRTYLKRWLELVAPDLEEGLHFTIMFFGGCGSLAQLSADPKEVNELIDLRSINPNAFVIVDSDREGHGHPLSDAISRLQAELGGACWVTEGREVENYLNSETVCRALGAAAPASGVTIGPYTDLIKDCLVPLPEFRWGKAKPKCASRIAPHITEADLGVLDLQQRLADLVATIRRWNLADRVVVKP